jgi:integral membrane protein
MGNAPNSTRRAGWGMIFAVVALIEAFTWAGLLIGMFLKYVTETTTAVVSVFGALHGGALVAYSAVALIAWWRLRWSAPVGIAGLLAGIPPLFTLVFEIWVARRGLLQRPEDRHARSS